MDKVYEHIQTTPDAELVALLRDEFPDPVPGVVYHAGRLGRGIPLGGIGTGYLELTGDGRIGDTTIFNHFPAGYTWEQPPRIDRPFLALCVNSKTRVLALAQDPSGADPAVGEARYANELAYWGHYPFADLSFVTDLPIDIGLSAWSPFVPGDAESSNIPAAVFELSLLNQSDALLQATIGFVFPAVHSGDKQTFHRERIDERPFGITTTSERYGRAAGYALCMAGVDSIEVGSAIGIPERPWSDLNQPLGTPDIADPETTITGQVRLAPGQRVMVTIVVAWYYPSFQVGYAFPYEHAYGYRYPTCEAVIKKMTDGLVDLKKRSLDWQRVVYGQELPGFLRDSLVNGLCALAKNSWWIRASGSDDTWGQDGLFTISESFRDCPVTECVPCRFFGHFPLLMLFPELEKTTLLGLANYQLRTGEIPFALAYGSGLYDPRYHCVHPLNSSFFVQMVYRYYLRTGDFQFVFDMLPVVKGAVRFLQSLDSDEDGLVNEHPHQLPSTSWPANNYHDAFPWYGTSTYTAGTWLATLRAASQIAYVLGERDFKDECDSWIAKGVASFESKLWAGSHYVVYSDPENDRILDASLLNQLIGEWCTRQLGLASVLRDDRANQAIDTVLLRNVAAGTAVPVDTVDSSGTAIDLPEMGNDPAAHQSSACIVSEATCFAMTLLWRNRKSEGLQILESIWRAHAVTHKTPFDLYFMIDPADGKPIWGCDYYSNMIVWAIPMALFGQNLSEYTRSSLISGCVNSSGGDVA